MCRGKLHVSEAGADASLAGVRMCLLKYLTYLPAPCCVHVQIVHNSKLYAASWLACPCKPPWIAQNMYKSQASRFLLWRMQSVLLDCSMQAVTMIYSSCAFQPPNPLLYC